MPDPIITAYVEDHHVGRDYLIRTHRHPVYEIIYLIAGRSEVTAGDATVMAGPGDLLVFSPGLLHREHVQRGPLHQLVLRFPAGAAAVAMPEAPPVLSGRPLDALRRAVEAMAAESAAPDTYSPAMREALLTETIVLLARALGQAEQPPWIEAAVTHLRLAGRAPRIDVLAREHGLAPSTLRARIKAVTGLPPSRIALLGRLERARDLLRDTTMSVTAVALALGFSSPQHLSHQVRQHLGTTPSAIRARRTPSAARQQI